MQLRIATLSENTAIWAEKYARLGERDVYIGIPFSREELEALGASFTLTKEPVWISDDIVTSGEIPMMTEYEEINPNLYVKEGEELVPDPLLDDRALIIKTDEGLVIILGCAHRGMINTVHHAREVMGWSSSIPWLAAPISSMPPRSASCSPPLLSRNSASEGLGSLTAPACRQR